MIDEHLEQVETILQNDEQASTVDKLTIFNGQAEGCPFEDQDTLIFALYRDGEIVGPKRAQRFRWLNQGDSLDIMAYWKAPEDNDNTDEPGYEIPEGWQLVPVEPTHDMVQFGADESLVASVYTDRARRTWKGMLERAPKMSQGSITPPEVKLRQEIDQLRATIAKFHTVTSNDIQAAADRGRRAYHKTFTSISTQWRAVARAILQGAPREESSNNEIDSARVRVIEAAQTYIHGRKDPIPKREDGLGAKEWVGIQMAREAALAEALANLDAVEAG